MSCGSPLGRLITTGNPGIPDDEIQADGFYYVSVGWYCYLGAVKYYQNRTYGEIQNEFLSALNYEYGKTVPKNVVMINGPFYSKEQCQSYRNNFQYNCGRVYEVVY